MIDCEEDLHRRRREESASSGCRGDRILSFFKRNNFAVTDKGETITFEGMMVPSRGQAALSAPASAWQAWPLFLP
ncbi:hypothetical protein QN277_009562 [Acacia crassicarpa]|uniref:Uncharacterized protein n=1 Tax=Acacia crassicarpa TaxID=499986 RepID=A0AAE1M6Z3_9FABA|nr:hypothetical protein QN277_009562 [Acacia crassicarpa]